MFWSPVVGQFALPRARGSTGSAAAPAVALLIDQFLSLNPPISGETLLHWGTETSTKSLTFAVTVL